MTINIQDRTTETKAHVFKRLGAIKVGFLDKTISPPSRRKSVVAPNGIRFIIPSVASNEKEAKLLAVLLAA